MINHCAVIHLARCTSSLSYRSLRCGVRMKCSLLASSVTLWEESDDTAVICLSFTVQGLQLNWVWFKITLNFSLLHQCQSIVRQHYSTFNCSDSVILSNMIRDYLLWINKNRWLSYTHNLITVYCYVPLPSTMASCHHMSFLQGLLLDKQIPAPSLFYGEAVQYTLHSFISLLCSMPEPLPAHVFYQSSY